MTEPRTELYNNLDVIIRKYFVPEILSELNEHKKYLNSLQLAFADYPEIISRLNDDNQISEINNLIEINADLKQKIKSYYATKEISGFDEQFPGFVNSINELIESTDEFAEEIQTSERFDSQTDDPAYLKLLKFGKRGLFWLDQLPVIIKNQYLKLRKKQLYPLKQWKQKIPLNNFTALQCKVKLPAQLATIYKKLNLTKSKSLLAAWKVYEGYERILQKKLSYFELDPQAQNEKEESENYNFNTISKVISEFENGVVQESINVLNSIINEFNTLYPKAATIEFPARKFSKKIIDSEFDLFKSSFVKLKNGWHNTLFALTDDWAMNNDVYLIRYKIIEKHLTITGNVQSAINGKVISEVSNIVSIFDHVNSSVDAAADSADKIYEALLEQKVYLDIKLRQKLVPKIINLIVEQDLPTHFSEIETSVLRSIDSIESERKLVKHDSYDRDLKDSELSTFSPKELLQFSALPQFQTDANNIKKALSLKSHAVQNKLNETEHIASFSLDSAIAFLESKKGESIDAKKVVVEGLQRSTKKYAEIENEIQNFIEPFAGSLKSSTERLNKELTSITQTDAIYDLRLKLTKAKALEHSKEIKRKTIASVKNILPRIVSSISKGILKSKELITFTRTKLGYTTKKVSIQSEISDFLAETKAAVSKLPYVYQRLFVAEPLTDEKFFYGREKEIEFINGSFSSWENGKYAPTIIIGEKGAGVTTLFNFYLKQFDSTLNVIRKQLDERIFKKGDLIELFKMILENRNLENIGDVIKHLNSSAEKQVIILENIQHLYLRKINGFDSLKALFEIISKTNKNVFWLCNCTIYAWNYLCKTITIDDYWGYIVKVEDFSDKEIIEMVLKRHRISGYDIIYEPSKEINNSKSFKKLNENEQQNYLLKQYCTDLNEFAQSNLSLALLFWLRSTVAVEKDVIKIGSIPQFDYSFLSNLNNDKIFTLSALILHDGLTEESISSIFQYPLDKCRLILLIMIDDGLIIEQNGVYLINPLLYRQVVRTLKSKNIIH